ncbi:MAG: hypothetical protein ACO3FR_08385 [Ilumatobacteraceae bacterium]
MPEKQLNCVICNAPFVRTTRGPVITCDDEECKYLNGRVTRMNASRKQQGKPRACGRCGNELAPSVRGHYCTEWCGPFRRTVTRRGRPPAGAPKPEQAKAPAKRGRPVTKVLGMDVSPLPEPHRSIVRMRFGTPGQIPMTLESVADALGLQPKDVASMETEALEAMGNAVRGVRAKRWRYA